nr:sperm flagellar protein 1 [Columba livia]
MATSNISSLVEPGAAAPVMLGSPRGWGPSSLRPPGARTPCLGSRWPGVPGVAGVLGYPPPPAPLLLSSPVLAAEVVKFFFPAMVQLHSYVPASSTPQKLANWGHLNRKVLSKLNFSIPADMIREVVQCRPGTVEQVLLLLRQKIEEKQKQSKAVPGPGQDPAGWAAQEELSYLETGRAVCGTSGGGGPVLAVLWAPRVHTPNQDPLVPSGGHPQPFLILGHPSDEPGQHWGGWRHRKGCPWGGGSAVCADRALIAVVFQSLPSWPCRQSHTLLSPTVPDSQVFPIPVFCGARGAAQILQLKVGRLEQLLHLKNVRIDDLSRRLRDAQGQLR